MQNQLCFFCDQSEGVLHRAATLDLDKHVRMCATELKDSKLIAKLASGDMHVMDAHYHNKCPVALCNKARGLKSETEKNDKQESVEGIALAQLMSYFEEARSDNEGNHSVFRLSYLARLYKCDWCS